MELNCVLLNQVRKYRVMYSTWRLPDNLLVFLREFIMAKVDMKCPLCQQIEPVKSMGWEPPYFNVTAVKLVAVAFNSNMNTEPASRA